MKDDSLFGSAPIIFLDDQKKKEWEELPESVKKNIFNMLHKCADEMSIRNTLDLLCHVINDLNDRLKKLESK